MASVHNNSTVLTQCTTLFVIRFALPFAHPFARRSIKSMDATSNSPPAAAAPTETTSLLSGIEGRPPSSHFSTGSSFPIVIPHSIPSSTKKMKKIMRTTHNPQPVVPTTSIHPRSSNIQDKGNVGAGKIKKRKR